MKSAPVPEQKKRSIEIELEPGRLVEMRMLTSEQFEQLYLSMGPNANQAWDLTQNGLRRSLVRDGDVELTYKDLMGPQLSQRFDEPAQLLLLRQAWEQMHMPSAEDQARVRAARVVVS
jgi:hypothetical protein